MAVDAVDEAIQVASLQPERGSQTETIFLAGGAGYAIQTADDLHAKYGWNLAFCRYLNRAYGDRCTEVAKIAEAGFGHPLAPSHPFIEAEVLYGARFESARTSLDVLARRLRLSFLDRKAALHALPRVQELLAGELGWDTKRKAQDQEQALKAL
jgi:glycerol-3-phosphate dehydrogenase